MRTACTILLAAWAGLVAPSAQADEPAGDILRIVPESAAGIVLVNHLKHTAEHIATLTEDLQLDSINPLGFAKAVTGLSEGIDERKSLAVVLFAEQVDARLKGAIVIPVSDYAKFAATFKVHDASEPINRIMVLERPMLLAEHAGYAIMVEPEHERFLKEFKATNKAQSKLAGPLTGWLESQAVAILTFERGTTLLFEKLQRLKSQFEQLEVQSGQGAGPKLSAMIAAFSRLNGEITHLGIGLQLDGGTAAISVEAALKLNGPLAREILRTAWPVEPGLGNLPAGRFVVATAGSLPQAWMFDLARAKLTALGALSALGPDERKEFDQSTTALLAHVRSLGFLLRPPAGQQSLLRQTLAVMRVDDSREYLRAHEIYLQKLEKLSKNSRSAPLLSQVTKTTLEGMPALEVILDISSLWPENADLAGQAALGLEKLFGPDRQFLVYLAALDEHRLIISYGNRERLVEASQELRGGKTVLSEAGVAEALSLLPKDSSWVAVIGPGAVVQMVNGLLPAIAPSAHRLPEFPKSLPAVARIHFTPDAFDARLVLPKELIVKLGRYQASVRQRDE